MKKSFLSHPDYKHHRLILIGFGLCLLIFTFGYSYVARADITTNLEVKYSFEEGSGTTVADASGNLHAATLLNGASYTAASAPSVTQSSYSLLLDGVNDYVESNATVSVPAVFSASAWIYPTALDPAFGDGIVATAYNDSFALFLNASNHISWYTGGQPTIGNATIPLNAWTHVVATWDGTHAKVYVNGVLDVDGGDYSGFGLNTGPTNHTIRVGQLHTSGEGKFTGRLDEVAVFSRALSSGDVTELYNDTGSIPPDTTKPVISSIASSTGPTTATITWNTNEGATSTVRYGATSSYGAASSSAALDTAHTIALSGLSGSTAYHFQISSADSSGNIATSSDLIFTTGIIDLTTPIISSIATSTASSSATITWTTDDVSDTQVEYGTSATYSASTSLNAVATTSHSVTIAGLTNGTAYHFRILSRNTSGVLGTTTDRTFTTTTPGPAAPTYVSAKGLAPDIINLVWYRPEDGDGTITSYKVYRGGILIATIDPVAYLYPYMDTAVNAYIDRAVSPSTTYSYYVVAHDSSGYDSPHSVTVQGTTIAGSIGQILPASRRADWTPGTSVGVLGGIDQYVTGRTNLIDVTASPYNADKTGATDSAAAIQAAIDAATSGDVVYLPAGTYRTNSAIYVQNKSNVTIRGAGMDSTIIDSRSGGLQVRGTGTENTYGFTAVLTGATKGSSQFTIADASSYHVDDFMRLKTLNDNTLPVIGPNGTTHLRGQLMKITAIANNTVSFWPAVISDVDPTHTEIEVVPSALVAANVGFEDLTLDGSNGIVQVGVSMTGTYNSWIKNVKVMGVTNYGISFADVLGIEVRHSRVDFDSGGGSNHAGLLSGHMNSSLIEDNMFINAFPVIEINFSSVGNVFAYNYMSGSGSNTNHGAHNDYNLYEGNNAVEFKSDGYYGSESNATFFRNYSAYFVGKRFSRNFNFIGNVGEVVSIGQPNIGNGSSDGIAQPSQGIFWQDWNATIGPTMTGTFTKTSSTAGTFHFDSHADAVRLFGYHANLWSGSPCIVSSTYHSCNTPGTLDWGLGQIEDQFRYTNVSYLDLDTDTAGIENVYLSGAALPNSGTHAALWPRSEGFQELDMDVALTSLFKKNSITYNGGIRPFEALANGETIPNSLFRSSKPAYFGNLTWPAIDPANSTTTADDIPAGYRYNHNGADPGADSTPPGISGGLPSVALAAGTTGATLQVTTDESATCKYGTVAGTAYASIVTAFGTTGGTTHTQSLTGLTDGVSYSYYVRCSDGSNATLSDYTISFSVAAASGGGGGGAGGGSSGGSGGTHAIIYGSSTPAIVMCATGQIFSVMTGQRCTAWSGGSSGSLAVSAYRFIRNLTIGSKGEDVKQLQKYLNNFGFKVASAGAGSSGLETTTFGPATQRAVAKYQTSKGIKPAAGYFGLATRASVNGTSGAVQPVQPAVTFPSPFGMPTATIPNPLSGLVLRFGSSGPGVKILRQKLRAAGYLAPYGSAPDVPASAAAETSSFGATTEAALRKFQCDKSVVCTGTAATTGWGAVGQKTKAMLGL
jgi:hypothetical protein